MTQSEFSFRAPPRTGHGIAATMIAHLAVNRGWLPRRYFAGIRERLTSRQCRLGRVASHSRIIAGQKGYKLLRYATPEEVREYDQMLADQIRALQHERLQVQRRAHRALARKGE